VDGVARIINRGGDGGCARELPHDVGWRAKFLDFPDS